MNELIRLIILIFVVILAILFYLLIPTKCKIYSSDKKINQAWCGTKSYNRSNNYSEFVSPEIGKKLFKDNCASCHAKNMVSKATGPPLSKSFNRWENDTNRYKFYLSNSGDYLTEYKDERIIELREEYDFISNSHLFKFDDDEIASILMYIN